MDREADVRLLDRSRAHVRGHHDHRVAEADRAPLAVREPAVFQNLQQRVEHIRVRLFDLVEQHHRIRLAPQVLGELSALFVADVSRRRPDHARHRVLLHVLGHVDAHHGALVVEQEFGQRPRQLRLADAGRSQEQEAADRPMRVAQSGAVAADGVRDQNHSFVLPHDALLEALFHVHQLLDFAFEHARDRDSGPLGDDAGDILLVNLFLEQRRAGFDRLHRAVGGFQLACALLDLFLHLRIAAQQLPVAIKRQARKEEHRRHSSQ